MQAKRSCVPCMCAVCTMAATVLHHAAATKLYLHYEGYPNYTYILHGTADDQRNAGELRRQFVEAYNAHFGAGSTLDAAALRVLSEKRRAVDAAACISKAFKAGSDVYMDVDPAQPDSAAPVASAAGVHAESRPNSAASPACAQVEAGLLQNGSKPATPVSSLKPADHPAPSPVRSSNAGELQAGSASAGAADNPDCQPQPQAFNWPGSGKDWEPRQANEQRQRHGGGEEAQSPLVGPFMERARASEARKHLRDAACVYEEVRFPQSSVRGQSATPADECLGRLASRSPQNEVLSLGSASCGTDQTTTDARVLQLLALDLWCLKLQMPCIF